MRTILNILWLVLGGVWSAIAWFFVGILCAITIIGLPWARSCFMLANYTLWPFGRDVISRDELYGREDIGTGALGLIGNVLWFVLAGWWLAVMHLTFAVANAVTIIGIPFAWAHVKLAGASLFPVGKTVEPNEVIEEAMRKSAHTRVQELRNAS
ncbi:MAG: YccF domain-containing protein [Anderseniella sp.]